MRILIVSNCEAFVGGIETYIRALVPHFLNAKHDVCLMFEVPSGERSKSDFEPAPGLSIATTALTLDQALQWRPDVVYSQGLADDGLETQLANAIPTVRFAHGYSGTCISGTKCFSNAGYKTCRRTLGPACLACYFPLGCGGTNPFTMLTLYWTQLRRRREFARFRALLVASRHMAEEYRRNGVDTDRLHLLPLFPPKITPDASPPPSRPRTDRVLFVGRLVALKGALQLVDVIAKAGAALGRPLTLVIAGEGNEAESVRRQADTRSVNVELLGYVNAERRTQEMRNADLLLVPSLWPEPFGLVGIEAGCVGLPAVGYRKGGISDWLRPGKTGESPAETSSNPDELAAAVVRALADDDHWNILRLGAWKASQEYGATRHVDKLIQILQGAAEIRSGDNLATAS